MSPRRHCDVNLDCLAEVVSARFLPCEAPLVPFLSRVIPLDRKLVHVHPVPQDVLRAASLVLTRTCRIRMAGPASAPIAPPVTSPPRLSSPRLSSPGFLLLLRVPQHAVIQDPCEQHCPHRCHASRTHRLMSSCVQSVHVLLSLSAALQHSASLPPFPGHLPFPHGHLGFLMVEARILFPAQFPVCTAGLATWEMLTHTCQVNEEVKGC